MIPPDHSSKIFFEDQSAKKSSEDNHEKLVAED